MNRKSRAAKHRRAIRLACAEKDRRAEALFQALKFAELGQNPDATPRFFLQVAEEAGMPRGKIIKAVKWTKRWKHLRWFLWQNSHERYHYGMKHRALFEMRQKRRQAKSDQCEESHADA